MAYEYESIGTIYKATCKINQKSYIGFCAAWPRRQKHHRTLSNRGSHFAFHRAIRKHGWNNFEWEILYQTKDISFCLNEMESYFIQLYETHGLKGYNCTVGGDGVRGPKSEKTKQKLSLACKKSAKQGWDKRRELYGISGGNSTNSAKLAWETKRKRYAYSDRQSN